MSQPLLTSGDGTPILPAVSDDCFFRPLEARGEFTGERLRQQRPDAYRAVVVLIGKGVGVQQIGKLLSVSPNTVMAVRDCEGVSIHSVKQVLARTANNAALLASEAILDSLNSALQRSGTLPLKELKDLAVVYGILVQHGQLLAGQVTSRIETVAAEAAKPEADDWNAYVAGLPSAKTHSTGERLETKEGIVEVATVPATVPGATAKAHVPPGPREATAGTDTESDGKPPIAA